MLSNTLSVILIVLGIVLALSLFGVIEIPLAFVYIGIFIVAIALLIVIFYRKRKMEGNNS
ncbi:hypothetical protein AM499_18595 [Bacillus sp. FJAT-22090]|uniref:hypothetical protein n=1 Tax=Bacillus sp. FJAT-22090 TaxID=1581038 RepID=UPI0006ADE25F|nr:hypothetical protein [Bacillus sp. FJAT-22090]ALC87595.1 hypothetical protein AM499_18595 [Bacillus sp. FJAT-22090]